MEDGRWCVLHISVPGSFKGRWFKVQSPDPSLHYEDRGCLSCDRCLCSVGSELLGRCDLSALPHSRSPVPISAKKASQLEPFLQSPKPCYSAYLCSCYAITLTIHIATPLLSVYLLLKSKDLLNVFHSREWSAGCLLVLYQSKLNGPSQKIA